MKSLTRLAAALATAGNLKPFTVVKRDGETWIEGLSVTGQFHDEEEE